MLPAVNNQREKFIAGMTHTTQEERERLQAQNVLCTAMNNEWTGSLHTTEAAAVVLQRTVCISQ